MTATRRWLLVGLGVVLLVAAPFVVRALPVGDSPITANRLLARIAASTRTPYSGLVESQGRIALPDDELIADQNRVLGSSVRERVWWAGPDHWRTATLRPTGETDYVRSSVNGRTRWVFESKRTTYLPDARVRLADFTDLLPPTLAGYVLQGARPGEVSRLPSQRVAGLAAAGLRLVPAGHASSVGHVDVYADPRSGLPVSVAVYARGGSVPVLATHFVALDQSRPSAADLRFTSPPDASSGVDDTVDLAATADRYSQRVPPHTLAGLPSRQNDSGSVGVYGRGPTVLYAVPVPDRYIGYLRERLHSQPGVRAIAEGLLTGSGPVGVLVSRSDGRGDSWVLAGTVRHATLRQAARQIHADPGLAPVTADTVVGTHGLTKRYGAVLAVDGVDLDVREGDVYGFLGANGSGKTTSVRMVLGLVLATSGEIELLGQSMPRAGREVLPAVGTLVEGPAAYGHLSARTNLRLFDAMGRGGALRTRRRRVDDVLEQVGLTHAADRRVKGFSLGMRQRLGLAAALLRQPRLLVLDEPTNGLDPQGIREIRELLLALNARGTTVFLSSHLLAEIEQMCTRVGVLDRGRLVVQDELATLRGTTGRTLVVSPDLAAAHAVLPGAERIDGRLVVDSPDSAGINRRLVEAGVAVTELAPERRTLEDVVLAATTPGQVAS